MGRISRRPLSFVIEIDLISRLRRFRRRGGPRVGRLSFWQIERELHGFFAIVLGNAISKFANGAANSASSNALIVIAPIP